MRSAKGFYELEGSDSCEPEELSKVTVQENYS
jgi:hypothetical protein